MNINKRRNKKSAENPNKNNRLIVSINFHSEIINMLFMALLLTSFMVFIGANLLLLDQSIAWTSAKVTLHCLSVILVFYAISRLLKSVVWGIASTYFLMLMLVYSQSDFGVLIAYMIEIFSVIFAIKFLRIPSEYQKNVLLMAAISAATILGVSGAYTSFDMIWRLHAGDVYQDTLFHASMAAMIKNYGISSVGVHGLLGIPYHNLSHGLFACISLLSGVGVVEAYGVVGWVLFAPVLVFSITACCCVIDNFGKIKPQLIWSLTAFLLALLPRLFERWAVWDSYFVSESYLVSLGLFMIGMMLLYKQILTVPDIVIAILVSILITQAKSSVGLIFVGLWFVRMLFLRNGQLFFNIVVFLFVTVAVGWVTYGPVSSVTGDNSGLISLSFFHFLSYSWMGNHIEILMRNIHDNIGFSSGDIFLSLMSVVTFFAIHFCLSWFVVIKAVVKNGVIFIFHSLEVLYVAASMFAGIVVASIFLIPGGSAYYFTNVSLFIALPIVVIFIADWIKHRLQKNKNHVVIQLILLMIVIIISFSTFKQHSVFDKKKKRMKESHSMLVDRLLLVREGQDKTKIMKYSPDSLLPNPVKICTTRPFLFPAISERPWIGVINIGEKCNFIYYGYKALHISESNEVGVEPIIPDGMSLEPFVK
jgi:hypothetical protein